MHDNRLADDAVIDITRAEYVPPYKIHLRFSDGAEQWVDFKQFLRKSAHPEIRKYLNTDLFRNFSIVRGRLDWNDYDLCFPLQDLYEGTIIKTSADRMPDHETNRQLQPRLSSSEQGKNLNRDSQDYGVNLVIELSDDCEGELHIAGHCHHIEFAKKFHADR